MDKLTRVRGEEYLENWAKASTQLKHLQIELNNLKDKDFLLVGLKQNENQDVFTAYEELLAQKKEKLNSILKSYYDVNCYIQNLEQHKQQIIILRYAQNFSWQAVSLKTHTSLRHCFNVRDNIIKGILSVV